MAHPTQARLIELFEDAGHTLRRKVTVHPLAKKGDLCETPNNMGYFRASVDGKRYLVHRLLWILRTGAAPSAHIDHVDGDKTNNRPDNLRDITQQRNTWNRTNATAAKSGVRNVYWCGPMNAWEVKIKSAGKTHHGGYFRTVPEAAHAAKAMRDVLHRGYSRVQS